MDRIGIDLGGTKIEIAVLDGRGEPVLRRRVPTPAGDYAATVEAIGRLVEEAALRIEPDGPDALRRPPRHGSRIFAP